MWLFSCVFVTRVITLIKYHEIWHIMLFQWFCLIVKDYWSTNITIIADCDNLGLDCAVFTEL